LKSSLNRVGYSLFFLYFVIAFLLRNHQTFLDEGSNLNLASCVLRGLHLYRDLFENHFPLPVYFSAAVISLTGVSLPSVRLAVLLTDAVLLLAIMRVSRLYFPVGLAAAIWAFVSPYYFGNLLLYDNLAMIGGIALGAVSFAALARGLEASRGMLVLLTIAGLMAALSNPFFLLVTGIAFGSLLFAPQIPVRFVVKLAIGVAAPMAAYLLYLAATGALTSFYSDTVVFNTVIYPKYSNPPFHVLPAIGKQLLLFDIFNADWLRSADPWRFNPITFAPSFDHWIFSGLFYRVAALLSCLLFAVRRNYRTAVFLYLFVAALPVREDHGFHAAPFVLFCLFLVGILIQEADSLAQPWRLALPAACALPALVLLVSGARYVAAHALESNFQGLVDLAQPIKEAAGNRGDVRLGHYPDGNYMYYLTGLLPVSKSVDFYPWVAEVLRPQLDVDLRRGAVILTMDLAGNRWGLSNYITLGSELAYAKAHLVKERFGMLTVYVSPSIAVKDHVVTAFVRAKTFKPGLYRNGEWRLAAEVDFLKSPALKIYHFGGHFGGHPDDVPVTGDWDGSGTTKIGVYRTSTGEWLLDYNGNGLFGEGDKTYRFGGQPGDLPVTGDWNGSGTSKIGVYRTRTGEWLLDYNGDGIFIPAQDRRYQFGGAPGDRPVVGDWTGSGWSKIGIVHRNCGWVLDINGSGRMEPGAATFVFGGIAGDVPVTGDWNGDGRSKAGLFRRGSSWLFDVDGDRLFNEGPDVVLSFGSPGDTPVTGAW
jgi:hypothetical protein